MKRITSKIPQSIYNAAPIFAVFGTVGLVTYIGYTLISSFNDIRKIGMNYEPGDTDT